MYGGLERGRWEPYHSGVLDSVGGRKRWEGKGRGGKEREGEGRKGKGRELLFPFIEKSF